MNTSWITSSLGYAAIGLTWLNQVFLEQGVPQSLKEWIAFGVANITGLIGVYAKDWNKSNSSHPQAIATIVPKKE